MNEYPENNHQNEPTQNNPNNQNGAQHQADNNRQGQDPYRTTGSNGPSSSWQPGQGQQNAGGYGQWNHQTPPQPGSADPHMQGGQYRRNQNGTYQWNFADYEGADSASKHKKKKRKGLMVFTGVICSLFGVAVIGLAGVGIWNLVGGSITDKVGTASSSTASSTAAENPGLTISDVPKTNEVSSVDGRLTTKQIYAKVSPSVVGIVSYVMAPDSLNPFGGSSLQSQEGSGIVMSQDGYIITNAHVIEKANGFKVVLNNGEEYEARLVGSDPSTDLAVLRIDADNLTPAEFGDSTQMEVGESVVAIGNPGGLQLSNSMSLGIVSGLNRSISSVDGSYTMNYIQTDAAINPGNSGGALVNEFGQVIGINSIKIAETEYEGLGFAIPIKDAQPIVDDLIANGRVTGRVRLGVEGKLVDEMTARYNGVPAGFMVFSTEAGSDISLKGIVTGDIITQIDDMKITSQTSIMDYLKNFKPGDKVTLTVYRRTTGRPESTFQVEITLIEDVEDDVVEQPVQPQSTQGDVFSQFFTDIP